MPDSSPTSSMEKKYEGLSPFELKNHLIEMASSQGERMMLNAGRGNPNWIATEPRHAFFEFGRFALTEGERKSFGPGLGAAPDRSGSAKRFEAFLMEGGSRPGIALLRKSLDHATKNLKLDPDACVGEFVDAILGDHYPVPMRILDNVSAVVHGYLQQEMFAGQPPPGRFDLFATEGGTAAMTYIFNSLRENKLLHAGDKIAIGTPIFTPYLEIPELADYQLVELDVEQSEDEQWQYPDSELEKLEDPAVKAFFVVNPANPASVAMRPESLERIAALVNGPRKDLLVLTDDVYGTFVEGFRSLAAMAPRNTILVYSYSKYFGATGWRLGVIAIHENNVFDERIKALPADQRAALAERYHTVALDPANMKLIERMAADSRAVALHHTSGLSAPQQVQMALFSLFALTDSEQTYRTATRAVVRRRYHTLYEAIGIDPGKDALGADYYTTIDVPQLARNRYDDEFANWLVAQHEPIDFVWRLAEERSVVLMDGGGFDAPNMSVRVSLANLPDEAYEGIGKAISALLEEYHDRWKAAG